MPLGVERRRGRADRRRFALQMHFQPIVDLVNGHVVGYEALARDTSSGTTRAPADLFAGARQQGRLAELDWACRTAALQDASALAGGTALFVNTDPAAAGTPPPAAYLHAEASSRPGLVRVLEVTERALAHRPGPLLHMVDLARRAGWRIALDDVGVQAASLSLMPFLRPDVIKLDLRLVQDRTTVQAAEVVSAVAVQAAHTGAVVLAEGIETAEHADQARSMGASLGQGHLLGRPAPLPASDVSANYRWPTTSRDTVVGSPWQQLPSGAVVRRATKPLLVAVSRWLERQAVALGEPAFVLATFERARYFTPATARRYADLAHGATLVGVLAQQMPAQPATGVRGVALAPDEPLSAEWNVLVLGPHFAGALLSHDLGDDGPDALRRFDYTVTYDREQVLAAAEPLLRRLPDLPDRRDVVELPDPSGPPHAPQAPASRIPGAVATTSVTGAGMTLSGPTPTGHPARVLLQDPAPVGEHLHTPSGAELTQLLGSALAASSNGLAICDAGQPDLPLIYVNPAFERLSGYRAEDLIGRNPRLLQGPDTDPEVVNALRAGVRAGREVRATLRNQRPDGSRWWNEMNLVPIREHRGEITHWIGTLNDVTDRVEAERQVAYLAQHDALTGLANRRALSEHLPAEIGRAGRNGTTVALLYLDLDGFKHINDTYGHDTGDQLLVAIAQRLSAHVRVGDLLVRQGGDEFLIVLAGLPGALEAAVQASRDTADKLRAELRTPFHVPGTSTPLSTGVSIGVSLWPHHGNDAASILARADAALYLVKTHGRDGTLLHGDTAAPAPASAPSGQQTAPYGTADAELAPGEDDVAAGDDVAALRSALTDQADVQRAVGLLMGRNGLTASAAMAELQRMSRTHALSLDQLAHDLLRRSTSRSHHR